jgi:hypothetical protein
MARIQFEWAGPMTTRRKMLIILPVAASLLACSGTVTNGGEANGGEANGGEASGGEANGDVQESLMSRWNMVGMVVMVPEFGNFGWPAFDQFPHPTYKGGSAQAYALFADVLVAFFDRDDNFDFLAKNKLFQLPLTYVFPSGQVGVETTFEQLTSELSSNTWASISADTHQKLQGFELRISAAL